MGGLGRVMVVTWQWLVAVAQDGGSCLLANSSGSWQWLMAVTAVAHGVARGWQ